MFVMFHNFFVKVFMISLNVFKFSFNTTNVQFYFLQFQIDSGTAGEFEAAKLDAFREKKSLLK